MNDQRLGDDVLHAETRIERGERILKNDLQIATQPAHFAAAGRQQIAAFEMYGAGSGLDQAKDEASQSALAGTGFPYETKRLTGVNVERNVIDRANLSARLAPKRRFAMREHLRQIADFKQRHNAMLAAPATDLHGSYG